MFSSSYIGITRIVPLFLSLTSEYLKNLEIKSKWRLGLRSQASGTLRCQKMSVISSDKKLYIRD